MTFALRALWGRGEGVADTVRVLDSDATKMEALYEMPTKFIALQCCVHKILPRLNDS